MVSPSSQIRQQMALIDMADIVICTDSPFATMAEAVKTKTIVLAGPRGIKHKHFWDGIMQIDKSAQFPCLPCWRDANTKCMVNNGNTSLCLSNLGAAEVFAKYMRLRNELKKEKGEVK